MHPVFDSLYNLISGLGTAKDPTTAAQYYLNLLSRTDCENAYRSDWIARKIVDVPAEDATREWRNWQASQPQIEAIEAEEKKHDIQRKMKRAIIRSRLYGGAALVFGVKNQDPAEELDLEAVGDGDLDMVVVLNRYELMAGPRIYNVDSPWYTRPQYYTIATPLFGFLGETGQTAPKPGDTSNQWVQSGQARVHPSHVIEFVGNELPDWRLIPMGGGWGDSVLQTVDEVLKDIGMVIGGMATMVNDAKVDVIKIPDFSKKIATTEYANRLLSRFAYANQAKSTVNSILLDTEEEWQRVQSNFGGLPNLLHEYMTLAAGAASIPVSRLIGQAAARGLGQNQSTSGGRDTEERNYYDQIASKQKNEYAPAMAPLDECIVRSSTGAFDPNIFFEWNSLWQLDEEAKADIQIKKANACKVDVETGLINEDALRRGRVTQLIEDGTYPGIEDAIDEFGEEPEEADIEVPWSRLAGAVQAQLRGSSGPNGNGNGGDVSQGKFDFTRLPAMRVSNDGVKKADE